MYRSIGYRGDWGYRGGWRRGPHPLFFFPALLVFGFIFFGLFKLFLPLIALGLIFMGVRALMHGGFSGHGSFGERGGWGRREDRRAFWNQQWNWRHEWAEKGKHDWMSDEKPKRDGGDESDQPRYARTPSGDWVEII